MPEAEGLAYVVIHGGGMAAGAVDCPVCHTRNSVGYSWLHRSNGWLRWRAACSYCEFIEVGRQYRPVEPVMVISQAINEEAAMGITEGDLLKEVRDPVLDKDIDYAEPPDYCECCGSSNSSSSNSSSNSLVSDIGACGEAIWRCSVCLDHICDDNVELEPGHKFGDCVD